MHLLEEDSTAYAGLSPRPEAGGSMSTLDTASREMTPEEIEQRDNQILDRLAVLIAASGRGINYTAALEMAKWITEEARRCGWFLYV